MGAADVTERTTALAGAAAIAAAVFVQKALPFGEISARLRGRGASRRGRGGDL